MKTLRFHFIFYLLLICFAGSSYAQSGTLELTIIVKGGLPETGLAIVSLFNSEETFLKKPKSIHRVPIDGKGKARIGINNLSPGRYAVSVTYDEDSNGELNSRFLGIPTELVGFSNDVKGVWGPPSFQKAAFDLTSSRTIDIHLSKARD